MKKLLNTILIICMLVSLTACGGKPTDETTTTGF
jgi:predicted small lipoprotein YifL